MTRQKLFFVNKSSYQDHGVMFSHLMLRRSACISFNFFFNYHFWCLSTYVTASLHTLLCKLAMQTSCVHQMMKSTPQWLPFHFDLVFINSFQVNVHSLYIFWHDCGQTKRRKGKSFESSLAFSGKWALTILLLLVLFQYSQKQLDSPHEVVPLKELRRRHGSLIQLQGLFIVRYWKENKLNKK